MYLSLFILSGGCSEVTFLMLLVCSLFSSGFGFEFPFMCVLSSIIESSYTSRIVPATQYVS
jgi:hypothetical protein